MAQLFLPVEACIVGQRDGHQGGVALLRAERVAGGGRYPASKLYAQVHTADWSTLDTAGVKEFLRERISSYKVPHTVEFVSTPLRDDAGKARRSAVRAEMMARLPNPEVHDRRSGDVRRRETAR